MQRIKKLYVGIYSYYAKNQAIICRNIQLLMQRIKRLYELKYTYILLILCAYNTMFVDAQ